VSINHLKQHKTKKSYVKIAPMANQARSQQTAGPFQQAEFEDRELEILEELIYTEHTLAEEANSRTNKRNQKN
jgi:precorrin-6B methylase 1